MKLVDFHTHWPKGKNASDDFSLYCHANIDEDLPKIIEEENLPFTVGLHPWYLADQKEKIAEQLLKLAAYLEKENCLGLGECGLDRLKGPDLKLQIYALEKQLELATTKRLPLVVFHCVRAYPECLSVLIKSHFHGKVVFHDFGANSEITKQLIKHPQIYFSLGKALERKTFLEESLPLLPKKRLVLETDDESKLPIEERYRQLSLALGLSFEETATSLYKNTQELLAHTPLKIL